MPKTPTPTKLTTELLRQAGWEVTRVDHHEPYTHRTFDFLGVADLLAQAVGRPKMLVQLTSNDGSDSGNFSERKKKVLASDEARRWVETGGAFMVISWRRPSRKGKKLDQWQARIEELTIGDFAANAGGART